MYVIAHCAYVDLTLVYILTCFLLSMRIQALLFVGAALFGWSSCADDVILKPIKQNAEEVGLVLIQGAQIPPDRYIPLAEKIQSASNYSLWVGIPDFAFDVPEPIVISKGIKRVLDAMAQSGMKTTKMFYAAHSEGGVILQDYLVDNPSVAIGQMLFGANLVRKYRGKVYPTPTLVVGGELDGLTRVTRVMEEYYHRVLHPSALSKIIDFPVTVVKGMSHMQFASGDPPELVKLRDLKPEISDDEAHTSVASLAAAFMAVRLGNTKAILTLSSALNETGQFVQPIVNAYEYEGFYNFKPPCYDNPHNDSCTLGCPFSETAQSIMGGLRPDDGKVVDVDTFHPVYQINPVHLPHVTTNCSSPSPTCVLNSVTVTQCVYDDLDDLDTGFVPTSASELRVKLKSRQTVMTAAGFKNVDFNKTDGFSICKIINQESINWAEKNAGARSLTRYKQLGTPIVLGEDKGPYNVGPLWIWTPLSMKKVKDASGREVLEVRSVMMHTPIDYSIAAAAGMHYCKLLSPARVTEWMYVDGLRASMSL